MLHPRFGNGGDNLELVQTLLDTQPKLNAIEAQYLLLEAYQTAFGICDHTVANADQHPLKLVAMHPKENTREMGPMFNFMRRFVTYNVAKYSNLSFLEFIDQPRDVCLDWFRICEEECKNDMGKLKGLDLN